MRLFPLFLYAENETGKDPLGNPISESTEIGESEGRFSSWTDKEVALDNRNVTLNNRKIITPAKRSDLETADKVKYGDYFYSITDIRGDDYQRWRIVIVESHGSEIA